LEDESVIITRKYATATVTATQIRMRLLKTGSEVCATDSDWTPGAGDVKVSIDSGAEANIATLPAFTNGWWVFVLSIAESTGKSIAVRIDDATLQSDGFIVETFGHASAMYPDDLSVASPDLETLITSIVNTLTAAMAEPTAPPAATASFVDRVAWAALHFRNKLTNDGTNEKLYANNSSSIIGTRAVSDGAGTTTKGKVA
jgi:hypothetical protein